MLSIALAVFLVFPARAEAHHSIFDYTFERFEADGYPYGPCDGVPDFIDEFDNGVIDPPYWNIGSYNPFESAGLLHLASPGWHSPLPPNMVMDRSDLYGGIPLQDGAGCYELTLTWTGGTLPTGGAVVMSVTHGNDEAISITVGNSDPEGYSIWRTHRVHPALLPPGVPACSWGIPSPWERLT